MRKILTTTLCVVLGLFMAGFVLADKEPDLQPAAEAKTLVYANNVLWKGSIAATKSITVGTSKNQGKLYVKGYLQNPLKKKALLVKDDLEVRGNLKVEGYLEGNGLVRTENLAQNAVTADKLAQNAVTSDKLAQNAVTADKLSASSVTSEKIAEGAVTSAKIAEGTIGAGDLNFSSNSFVKAGGYVSADGTLSKNFNNLGRHNMFVQHNEIGVYTISISGLSESDRAIAIATPLRRDDNTIQMRIATVSSLVNGSLQVITFDSTGARANSDFYFIVF